MEKAHLEMYKSNAYEIEELKGKLKKMGTEEGKEKLVESDTILDYQKGYPRPQTVTVRVQDVRHSGAFALFFQQQFRSLFRCC